MAIVIGPTPPGTGVIQAARSRRRRELHVAAQLAVGAAIDAHVEYERAFANPFTRDVGRLAHGRDHEFRALHFAAQVARARVAHGDGRAREQQLQRHRTADDVRRADHHGAQAGEVELVFLAPAG